MRMVHGSAHGGNAVGPDVYADPASAALDRSMLQGLHDGEAMRQFPYLDFENLHQGSRLRLLRFIAALAVAMAAATLPVTSPAPLAASAVADCAAMLDRSARL